MPSQAEGQTRAQFDSLPLGLRDSAGVDGKEKSTGDGGGAGVSPNSWVERDEMVFEALKAALTSWPRLALVRMERRWRGLEVVWRGIVKDVVMRTGWEFDWNLVVWWVSRRYVETRWKG